jgi:hypothetical protein
MNKIPIQNTIKAHNYKPRIPTQYNLPTCRTKHYSSLCAPTTTTALRVTELYIH